MSGYRTPADYAAQTAKWRDAFGIWPNVSYAEQVRIANEEIAILKTSNPSRYKEFMADAQAWAAREAKRAEEYNETRAPVTPSSSGRNHDNGDGQRSRPRSPWRPSGGAIQGTREVRQGCARSM